VDLNDLGVDVVIVLLQLNPKSRANVAGHLLSGLDMEEAIVREFASPLNRTTCCELMAQLSYLTFG
jgi:hypothetical protein